MVVVRRLLWFFGGVLALLLLAVAGAWWWSGQEGSLEWTLRRLAGGPLATEGVTGSLRRGWHIGRLTWEQDGLRVEVEDIDLTWEPAALLGRTVQVDTARARVARIVDQRPRSDAPLPRPDSLALPWRVVIGDLRIATLEYQGATTIAGGDLAGRYKFDGTKHEAVLQSLRLAEGRLAGKASIGVAGALPLDVDIDGRYVAPLPGGERKLPLRLRATARGPLAAFDVAADLGVEPGSAAGDAPSATVRAQVTPFERVPVREGRADVRHLDLAQFVPAAPMTALDGQVVVAPAAAGAWQLRADLRNAAAGPWTAGRLPLDRVRGEGEWRDGTALVRSLEADAGRGRIAGTGRWQGARGWRFEGRVDDIDPSALYAGQAAVPVSGPVVLQGEGQRVDFDIALKAAGGGAAPRQADDAARALAALSWRELTARGQWNAGALALPELRVRTADASADAQLDVDWPARRGSGKVHLQAPGLQADAQGDLSEMNGKGTLTVDARELGAAQRWLSSLPVIGPALAAPALAGAASTRLAWQGGWRDPAVQGRVQADRVVVGVSAPGGNAPPPWVVRTATLTLEGRLRDAQLALVGQAARGQREVDLQASGRAGRLGAEGWRGQVASLVATVRDPAAGEGAWQLTLRRPVDGRFGAGNLQVAAGEAVLRAPARAGKPPPAEAVVAWDAVRRQGGTLQTSGRVTGLPLAWLELVGGGQLAGAAMTGDMVFDAQWTAQLGTGVRIEASVARASGDLTVFAEAVDGSSSRIPAGVREARLTLRNDGEQLTLTLAWDSERAGSAQGQVTTRLQPTADGWTWPADAPLAGRVQARLPRLGVWSVLAPPGWRLRGSLRTDLTVAGTRSAPAVTGTLEAEDLALRSVVDGIELRNGHLRARFDGQRVVVDEFVLHGAEAQGSQGGSLTAKGEGRWTADGPVLQVSARLEQLRASIRDDRELTLSGPLEGRVDRSGTTLTGQLRFDRARIRIPDETAPRLGDDVVVRNAPGLPVTEEERRVRPAPTAGGRTVTLTVSVDMGDDFRVTGQGVDTRLAGKVEVEGRSLALPRLTGTLRTVGGRYEGYGQRMTIERGLIRFTGPADDPALEVLAIRPNLAERVGVRITGRAKSPHIELYSESGLSEAEALSWLVLGRSSAGGGAETALLQRAATALIAGRRGAKGGIASAVGLDDLSVGRDASGDAVVRLGKRFADNIYASYERSLSGAMGTLYLFYDVSRRLTLRAEAGEKTGVDLIFTFYFDGGRTRPERRNKE